ncbi:hypothetical protein ND450_19955 [Lentzea sp. HUAS12]|nr:hypothetical protein ND450_19955 [Lentzea sp. HUAS12]
MTIAARAQPDGLTGSNVGKELGVDRSSLWRHFADHQELLLAVGDRLLHMAVDQVPDSLPPPERVRSLAKRMVDVFVAHPYVAAQTSNRITGGPGELAAIELILASLEEVGLRDEALPR